MAGRGLSLRRTRRRWRAVPLAGLLLCLLASVARAETSRFVALTDLHFNPMASGMTPALDAAPVESWAALLDAAPRTPSGVARYGADTPWELMRSALDETARVAPRSPFVLLTGDLLAHQFRRQYRTDVPGADDARYAAFVRKTVAFVLQQVRMRFPDRPVYLALGNNDDECGDYKLAPGGAFLHATLPLLRQAVRVPEDDDGFARDWIAGRGYDVAGAAAGPRMVFLNSVFFSRNYADACGSAPASDPGADALDWLQARLAAAEKAGSKVWLLLHIPPGGDAFADLNRGECPDALLPMWKPAYTRRFLDLVARYRAVIAASFAGHTHMDEFRLLGRNGAHDAFTVSTPGVSPIFGQNPGFDVYTLADDGGLADRETWIVGNMARARTDAPLAWRREYVFTELWRLPRIDLSSLERLNAAIHDDMGTRAAWFSVYRVGNPAMWGVPNVESLPANVFRTYACAIGFVDPDEYGRCVCAARP